MDYKGLGMRVRKQRKRMHLTQDELAERAGISLSFLGHIERGSRKASVETLVALSNALCISTDLLLQESLSSEVLLSRANDQQERTVLREINRLLKESSLTWEDKAPVE